MTDAGHAHSDRPCDHALISVSHATGSTHVRTRHPFRGTPRDPVGRARPARRVRPVAPHGAVSCVHPNCPNSTTNTGGITQAPHAVRTVVVRPRHGDRCRPLGGLQLLPGPGGTPLVRHLAGRRRRHRLRPRRRDGGLPRPAAPLRTVRRTKRRTSHPGRYTGRLTGFRARARCFSANFRIPSRPRTEHPPPPVPPARKGSRTPCAPYADWPPPRGALPCTLHECNAS